MLLVLEPVQIYGTFCLAGKSVKNVKNPDGQVGEFREGKSVVALYLPILFGSTKDKGVLCPSPRT